MFWTHNDLRCPRGGHAPFDPKIYNFLNFSKTILAGVLLVALGQKVGMAIKFKGLRLCIQSKKEIFNSSFKSSSIFFVNQIYDLDLEAFFGDISCDSNTIWSRMCGVRPLVIWYYWLITRPEINIWHQIFKKDRLEIFIQVNQYLNIYVEKYFINRINHWRGNLNDFWIFSYFLSFFLFLFISLIMTNWA